MRNPLLSKVYFILFSIMVSSAVYGQAWFDVPPDQRNNRSFTLPEYQQMFEDHWAGKDVELGYYYEDGKKKKAYGWKQFKRWEYFWKSRVNDDGSFPSRRQIDVAKAQYKQSVLRSEQGDWSNLGPASSRGGYAGVGRINQIAFHPTDPNTFWVTTPHGGLWTTEDGGNTWRALSEEMDNLTCSAVAIPSDYETSRIIYVGTGDMDHFYYDNGIGLLKSIDGGNSWQETGLSFHVADNVIVNRILIHPNDDNFLYATTSNGVYRSYDAAETWEKIYNENNLSDLEFDPADPSILYGSSLTSGKIYKIEENGEVAGSVYNNYLDGARRIELSVAPSAPGTIYGVVSNSNNGLMSIVKSTDWGETYVNVFVSEGNSEKPNMLGWSIDGDDEGGQGFYDLTLAVDPLDANVVYLGGVNTWRTTNGGITWEIANHWSNGSSAGVETVHADKHFLKYNGSVLFECNDGGLYRTVNGQEWENISNGIINSEIYKIGVAQTSKNDVVAGLQDNGTKNWVDGEWFDVMGGDGMDCMIDHQDANIQYGESYYGNVRRTMNHWDNRKGIKPSGSNGAWLTPLAMDPIDPAIIYGGYQHIYKSIDRGENWEVIFELNSSSRFASLAIAPSDPNVIYAGEERALWKTTDGGMNWVEITSGLPNHVITSIAVHNQDPSTLWVTLGGYNANGIFQSVDGGLHWENISDGLPEIPVNTVVQNHQNQEILEMYVGTDFGIYLRLGNGLWERFSKNMPKVVTTDLEIYYDDIPALSKLRASTYGRGLWESDLFSIEAPPVAAFSADKTEITVGQTVNFTDETSFSPFFWEWTFEGGSPASSTEINPSVSYNEEGIFMVSLKVSNGTGKDTLVVQDYIVVACDTTLLYKADRAQEKVNNYSDISLMGSEIAVDNDDDANSAPIPIGFEFEFECMRFDSFVMNTNGFIKLGTTPPSGTDLFNDTEIPGKVGPIQSDDPADRFILAPFNCDLTGTGNGQFHHYTEGEAPYRICTIQFSHLMDKNELQPNKFNAIEFQVKLYETTHQIEFVYGDWLPNSDDEVPVEATVAVKGNGEEDDDVISVIHAAGNSWENVLFKNLIPGANEHFAFSNKAGTIPVSGQQYLFLPKYFRDLEVIEIYALKETPGEFGNPQTISTAIKNNGLNDIHDVELTLEVTGASTYSNTVTLDVAEANGISIASFEPFQTGSFGTHNLQIKLPEDEYNADNSKMSIQETTASTYNYANGVEADGAIGIEDGTAGILVNRYELNGNAWMESVEVFIADSPDNIGQQLMAVATTSADTFAFVQSEPLIIEEDDLNTWVSLPISDDTLLIQNQSFYAGVICLPSIHGSGYAPVGLQKEFPTREMTYFKSPLDEIDFTAENAEFGFKYMIGATVSPVRWDEGEATTNDPVICEGEKARVKVSNKPSGMEWQVSDSGLGSWYTPEGGFGLNNSTYLSDNLYKDQYYRIKVPYDDDIFAYSNVVYVAVKPVYEKMDTTTLCFGEGYVFPDGTEIDPIFEPMTYTSLFETTFGCDSTIRTTIDLLLAAYELSFDTLCKGADYVFDDGHVEENIESNLLYKIAFPLPNGCDSVIAKQLIVEAVETTEIIQTDTSLTAVLQDAVYQWIDCGNGNSAIEGATEATFIPDRSGDFAVVLDDGNCIDTSACVHFIHTGLEELSNKDIYIFPNPARHRIKIKSPEAMSSIKLVTLDGKVVSEVHWKQDQPREFNYKITELVKGVYLLKIHTASGLHTRKLLIK